jgi:hypothetical protein
MPRGLISSVGLSLLMANKRQVSKDAFLTLHTWSLKNLVSIFSLAGLVFIEQNSHLKKVYGILCIRV